MRFRPVAIFILLITTVTASASAAELIVQPGREDGKDALVRAKDPNTNIGNVTDLRFGGESGGPPGSRLEQHLYIEFDLSDVPAGMVVTDARLEFYMYFRSGNMAFTYGVYAVLEAWDEQTITWNNAPSSSVQPVVEFDGAEWQDSLDQWHAIPGLADLVQSWIDEPTGNHGITIRAVDDFYGTPYVRSCEGGDHYGEGPRLVLKTQQVATAVHPWSHLKGTFGAEQ